MQHTAPDLCWYGHALDESNVYRPRDGRRRCLECRRARDRRPARKRCHAQLQRERRRDRRRERRRVNCPTMNRIKTQCFRGHPFLSGPTPLSSVTVYSVYTVYSPSSPSPAHDDGLHHVWTYKQALTARCATRCATNP